jgi:hypothetical protein
MLDGEVEQFARGRVDPMRVLEHHHDRLSARQTDASAEFALLAQCVPSKVGVLNQSFIISDSVQRRHNGIGKAMKEKQLAPVRLKFVEIGCVCVEPRSFHAPSLPLPGAAKVQRRGRSGTGQQFRVRR